ncbi:sensor histidine kinase [Geodermatophilus sabuli]|uniref:Anti-sigma regulatory factor (Ser/Thr protein kinase) n=1 Tax=Geodermatophilus sabuli TaxID=1564158 RepID=A0A285EB96_9ACTN|nr:sensor histidine kinase [Geodermatophilus sabuli]MBB3084332.1 anti-sigma regulatory factor (Ser/Thr protein kinase) [Geodermatophilus sabuli]SNX96398.1 Anti-sigma regulatory factor (Ser/Thr protein kinase) [Geodermatophilus sabuli]
MVPEGGPPSGYVHDALFHDSPAELVSVAVPFLLDGLAAGDAAVVATGGDTAALLREAVGDDPRVHMLPRSDVYRARTPAAITTFRELAEKRVTEGFRRVRVVGEADFGPTPRTWVEWQRYEAVINDALAAWPLWGLCVFDTQRLPDEVVEAGRRTHPHVVSAGGRRVNRAFTEPGAYLRSLPVPREPLEDAPPRLAATGVADFIGLRHAVAAVLAGLDGDRDATEDFLLAVDEMTSNAVRHGRPPVDLRLWASADRVVCRITDRGDGLTDPFAGYGPAHGADLSRGGMGLWLARQLCDHVDITSDDDGVTVRLTSRLR